LLSVIILAVVAVLSKPFLEAVASARE